MVGGHLQRVLPLPPVRVRAAATPAVLAGAADEEEVEEETEGEGRVLGEGGMETVGGRQEVRKHSKLY